jgi:hypothetical protein
MRGEAVFSLPFHSYSRDLTEEEEKINIPRRFPLIIESEALEEH